MEVQEQKKGDFLTTKSISVVEGLVVIYQRERSSVWQVRVKLDDKRWHRYSTGEHDEKKAAKAAIKLFYDKEFKRENSLPAGGVAQGKPPNYMPNSRITALMTLAGRAVIAQRTLPSM